MRSPPHHHAFSLIELIIVVVIIGIIGAIAVPRMSNAADGAARNAVIGDLSALQKALDLYEIEHEGMMIHVGAADAKTIYYRMLKRTDLDGTINDATGIYGPYINGIPANKINGLATVRKDGAAAGADTHGWRYDSTTGIMEADHLAGATGRKGTVETVKQATDNLVKSIDP
tara:strand:+ start:21290 stop:21805 length:516 start_codon:yes stop_codon:yes gene_type:complete